MFKIVLFIIISCFFKNVQVTDVTQLPNGVMSILFNTTSPETCLEEKTAYLKVGQPMSFSVISSHYINMGTCRNNQLHINMTNGQKDIAQNQNSILIFPVVNFTKQYEGKWTCQFNILRDVEGNNTIVIDNHIYSPKYCSVNILTGRTNTNKKTASSKKSEENNWHYIVGGIFGLIVLIIIIIQSSYLIYYKKKANTTADLETLSIKFRNNEGRDDRKRYSRNPGSGQRKALFFSRLLNKTNRDESIYETLEEIQANKIPPTPPIETIPTLKQSKTENKMNNRPPQPLPEESYEEPMCVFERDVTMPPMPTITEKPKEMNQPTSLKPEAKWSCNFTASQSKATPGPSKVIPTPKLKPGNSSTPAPVISELDQLFKKRQHEGLPSPKKTPQGVEVKEKKSFFGMKQNRSASIAPPPKPKEPVSKMSLPDIKHNTLTKRPEPARKPSTLVPKTNGPVTTHPVVPNKPLQQRISTMTSSGNAQKNVPAPAIGPNPVQTKPGSLTPPQSIPQVPSPVRKPKLPSPVEVQAPPLPADKIPPPLPPLNQIQEPIYEVYEEEAIYNSDEEWTYEPLPQINIYSS